CQKQQTPSIKGNLSDANAIPTISTCSPIPDSLKVPEGNKFVLQTFARGFQIYEVQRSKTDSNVFVWVNIAPLATLYGTPDFKDELIHHFAGPTWLFLKGPFKDERVVAKKVSGVTPDATAIQWLLLKADSTLSSADNQITFVQRICTAHGLAPTTGNDAAHLGQKDSIPYTASYLFYTKN
ncbi:MAG: DUF3455 domain-containing protein, partial [Bacteroidia bacterium]